MDIVLENIAPPERLKLRKLPIETMEVGQSFIVPLNEPKQIASVRQYASRYASASGKKFSVLKQADQSYRLYRTA